MCDLTELTAVIINQSDDEKIEKLKKYTEVIH